MISAEITHTIPEQQGVSDNIRHGFVYERIPHITLKSIANNTEIDTIWEKWQGKLEALLKHLNIELNKNWKEWEVPYETQPNWPDQAKSLHEEWWNARCTRQKEIDFFLPGAPCIPPFFM